MTNVVRFFGDCHGEFGKYKTLVKNSPHPTIVLGDMGVGFRNPDDHDFEDAFFSTNPPHDFMVKHGARYLRGNHDNPHHCLTDSKCIKDGTIEDHVMFVGGGYSIDWQYRVEGYTWWEDEQLSYDEFQTLITKYLEAKPAVMVTHECPSSIIYHLNSHHLGFTSRTDQAFELMLQLYRPKLWIFGHHHLNFDQVIDDTRFVCVDMIGGRGTPFIDIDLDEYK